MAIDTLAATIAKFRAHFESRAGAAKKHVEHWKARLIELPESRLMERALRDGATRSAADALAGGSRRPEEGSVRRGE